MQNTIAPPIDSSANVKKKKQKSLPIFDRIPTFLYTRLYIFWSTFSMQYLKIITIVVIFVFSSWTPLHSGIFFASLTYAQEADAPMPGTNESMPSLPEFPSAEDSLPSLEQGSVPNEANTNQSLPDNAGSEETANNPETNEEVASSSSSENNSNTQELLPYQESSAVLPTEETIQATDGETVYEYETTAETTASTGSSVTSDTSDTEDLLPLEPQPLLSGGVQVISIETIYEIDTLPEQGIENALGSGTENSSLSGEALSGVDMLATMTIMQLDTTTVIFPENVSITTTNGEEKEPTDLTIIPEQAVTQLPDTQIAEITETDIIASAPLKHGDVESSTADNHALSVSGNTETTLDSTAANLEQLPPTKEPLQNIFEFGIVGEHLLFSSPVTIEQVVDFPDGSLVEVKTFHAGDTQRTTDALSVDGGIGCTQGVADSSSSVGVVTNGKVTFTTCGASTFSVTYTGGASAPNFVDNGTKDFTATVTTGTSFPTGSVIQDVNILIDFRPIDNESPTGPRGVTQCYPNEKSFLLIHPDGTSVQLANAGTYTTPTTNCPQAQIYYDQSAASGIVGGAWNLTGQSRQPVATLNTLNGKSPFGTRTLRMGDNANQDGVILFGFTLDIQNVECGDGIITSPEVCDDSNTDNDDGCSALCSIEAGWTCTGTPSVCTPIPAPTGLRVHYDGSMNGTLFADISGNGFDGTQFNGVTTGNQNGEITMCFNGTTQYIQRATNLVTAYPFTISTWMKSDTTAGLHGVVSFARSTSTNIMRNIEHNGTTIRANGKNTTARYSNATTALNTTAWFLVTAVYNSATDRDIYINGVYEGTSTINVNYSSNANNRLNIGRLADSSPSNYYDGCVDDVRMYSTALTSGQVYNLYAKPASLSTALVSVGSPQLTGTIQGTLDTITLLISGTTYTGTNLGNGTWNLSGSVISPSLPNGTYPVTLTVTNPYGRSVQYTSAFTVNIPAASGDYCIAGPSTITFPQFTTDSQVQTGFTSASGYFQLIDSSGADSGYYTTLQITNLSGSSSNLANTGISWQSTGIVLLSGTANTGVVLGSAFASYSVASGTVTYIKRDPAANGSKIGTYGAPLQLRITLPAYIKPDTYTGTITYTLYEN